MPVTRAMARALAVVVTLFVAAVPAGAEPKTTPVSEPPDPRTATTPCVRADRCRPIGELSVDPGQGLVTTEIAVGGDCGRSLASDEDSPFTPAIVTFLNGDFGGSWGQPPSGYYPVPLPYLDVSRGTFAYNQFSFASFLTPEFVALARPGVYSFIAHCAVESRMARRLYTLFWQTPPATFCLYAADDDPAGCTSTPGFADLAHQFGAWGFFSGEFIGEIGAQFTPPAAPTPAAPLPDVTTTTRRRATPATTPAVIVPPPPPPEVTTTTTLKPCVGKGCP